MIFEPQIPDETELLAIQRIEEIRGSVRYAIQLEGRWKGFLRRHMRAKAIQGSNTIEGYNVTYDEAVAVIEGEEIDVGIETRQALTGYRNAMDYILARAEDPHFTFNEELILGLHFMMISHDLGKHPGRWRPGPIFVRREPSGERVYEGPDADMVPGLMREFVDSVRSADNSIPIVIRAAMAHLNLVMIHPFSDGNGRMGRAIQTLLLARDELTSQEFMSIEEYLGSRSNTEAYYQVLAEVGAGSWHPERSSRPWTRFCIQAHLQQATTVQRRIREIEKLWGELETEIALHALPDRAIYALYEAAMGLIVRSSRYRTLADVSSQVASRDLRMYVEADFLVPKGEKRGRLYIASPRLGAIRDRIREAKIPAPRIGGQGQLDLPLQ